jgi:putative salt-induced outer membrane protein YdiY
MKSSQWVYVFLSALLLCGTGMADQVTLKNGDRLTGAIMKSDGKTLTIKYYESSVSVPWEQVDAISSSGPLYLTLKGGQVVNGPVVLADGKVEVETTEAGKITAGKDAVQIIRTKEDEAAHQAEIERYRNPKLLDLWTGFIDTGLAAARGNSETTTFNLGFNAARTTPRDKISVYVSSLYASQTTAGKSATTANAIRGGLRYEVNVSDKLFAFGFTDQEHDQFQALDLRAVFGGGFGLHAIKTNTTLFDLFGGASLNKEFFSTGLNRTSAEVLVGEELNHKVSRSTTVREKLSLYPNISSIGDYRLNFDSSIVTQLSRWLSWQASLSDRYLTDPVPGKKKNDVLLTTGLRVTFDKNKK